MPDPVLRIFSYLPNPRVWKSLIAADLCGVVVEVVGDKPANLGTWLWDYDAHPLEDAQRTDDSPHRRVSRRGFPGALFKTDAFMAAQPFGTVPAAFSPGGDTGVFESNSILRAVARSGQTRRRLYGGDPYEASRIDSFLDANLVFAREAQVYLLAVGELLAMGEVDETFATTYARMAAAYEFFLAGVENALGHAEFIAGDTLSIADISFVCDFAQFLREGHYEKALTGQNLALISEGGPDVYPRAYAHMLNLSETPEFGRHMGSYLNWYRKRLAAPGG
jgi:elongation factor 1-gamma